MENQSSIGNSFDMIECMHVWLEANKTRRKRREKYLQINDKKNERFMLMVFVIQRRRTWNLFILLVAGKDRSKETEREKSKEKKEMTDKYKYYQIVVARASVCLSFTSYVDHYQTMQYVFRNSSLYSFANPFSWNHSQSITCTYCR